MADKGSGEDQGQIRMNKIWLGNHWRQVILAALMLSAMANAADQQASKPVSKTLVKDQRTISKESLATKPLNADSSNTESAQPEKIYLNKNYWEKMNWQQAEMSGLWLARGWLPFEGAQPETFTFSQERKIQLFGKEISAKLGYNNARMDNKFFSMLYGAASKNDCNRLAKELTLIFGQPIFNDGTFFVLYFSEKNFMKIGSLSYQWDIGDTRIKAGCFGSETPDTETQLDKQDFQWTMKYAHRSEIEKLVPKFVLRCTRKFQFNDGSVQEVPDMVIWVDTGGKRVTNAGSLPVSDPDSFQATDLEIKFKMTAKNKMVTAYTLDRVTGSLSATVTDSTVGARITGKCEKSEAIEKKF